MSWADGRNENPAIGSGGSRGRGRKDGDDDWGCSTLSRLRSGEREAAPPLGDEVETRTPGLSCLVDLVSNGTDGADCVNRRTRARGEHANEEGRGEEGRGNSRRGGAS